MTKINVQICSNCGEENTLFDKNCKKCKHYLRALVINIDLWKTIWQLFESPQKALTNIVHAEHKNFISFLLLLLAIKFYLISVSFQSAFELTLPNTNYFILNFLLMMTIYAGFIIIFSIIFKWSIRIKIFSRFKDILSLILYSFIPIILSLMILTPVEYGIFGKHWFIYNPSPFIIKNTLAYFLVIIEGIMVIWSLVNLFHGFYLQTNSIKGSILSVIIFVTLLSGIMISVPFVIL